MATDFDDGSSKFGCIRDEFQSLSADCKEKLVTLMSRIMERAYRRGVQQALDMRDREAIENWIEDEPYKYRYGKPLCSSYGLDGFMTTSRHRLFIEEKLESIGFDE